MRREALEAWLEEGLSLQQIGRRVGRHPSTVSYWVEKYGLRAAHRKRHAPRGSIPRESLEQLTARDLTIREIAAELDRSPATVRYWMSRYGVRTSDAARSRAGRYARKRFEVCPAHGRAHFIVHRDGTTSCSRCRIESVSEWRRRTKRILVDEAGGKCLLCGYDRCLAALQFHHVDRATKRFSLGGRGVARALATAREEAAKCVLLCANCHAEVEAGVVELPR